MRLPRIVLAVCLSTVVVTTVSPASALSCVGVADWRSDTVFAGTVAEEREVDNRGGEYGVIVDEVWHGVVPAAVWVTYESIWDDPFPQVGTSYVVGLFADTTASNCTMVDSSADYVGDARPDVVRSPDDLGWWSRTWWGVGLALHGAQNAAG